MSDKKIALVTGASRGIGKATALALTEQGYFVVGTATSDNGAAAIAEYLDDNGTGRVLNVTEEGAIDALVSDITASFGPIAALVNNAGITRDNLLMRMKDAEWDDIIQTNLSAIFKLSKAVLRGMMKQRFGRIINVGSVVGSTGNLVKRIMLLPKRVSLVFLNPWREKLLLVALQ